VAVCSFKSDIGKICIVEEDENIIQLDISEEQMTYMIQGNSSSLLLEAKQQIELFLAGNLKKFTLPLLPSGTEFMKKVWEELTEVPYGQTASYKEIAVRIQKPDASRAVGMACGRNPIPLLIPCHRIIGSDGSLTGFGAGAGLKLKKKLLDIENNNT